MRAFIAIDLPEGVKDISVKVQEKIKGFAVIKPVKDVHITLKFLGDVDENQIQEIRKEISVIKKKKFKIHTSNIGVFPNQNFIRVVWIGFEPKKDINDLKKEIDNNLIRFGFKRDEFIAHATIARIKSIKNKERFLGILKEKIDNIEFEVNEFKLKKSTLTKQGPIYEDICSFDLI